MRVGQGQLGRGPTVAVGVSCERLQPEPLAAVGEDLVEPVADGVGEEGPVDEAVPRGHGGGEVGEDAVDDAVGESEPLAAVPTCRT